MNEVVRRTVALAVAVAIVVLVVLDQLDRTFRAWWDRHSFTGSVVESLLALAVTALIVDEVVRRRQRKERAVSVAVQALIVFGQARRVWSAVVGSDVEARSTGNSSQEVTILASMLLTAAPSLFDDPVSRRFLEEVERFFALVFRMAQTSDGEASKDRSEDLHDALTKLQEAVKPLYARIPSQDNTLLEGPQ